MKVFFDLDPAVYMSGFAAQKSHYNLIWEDSDGETRFTSCEDGAAKKKKLVAEIAEGGGEVLESEKVVTSEPESFALQCAKTLLTAAESTLRRKFKSKVEVEYYLTGESNYRDDIATIVPYKGNREDMVKPAHYAAVRQYFIDKWGAEIVDGIEADDEVSIRSWELWRNKSRPDYVVASIDKDLDQIPGMHYDYGKHVFYEVDELEAEMFFYAQTLAGDSTDNIKGCYRLGLGKSSKMVDEWFREFESKASILQSFESWVWPKIVDTYKANRERYPEQNANASHLTAEEQALENARLVYMLREEDELWTPSFF